MLAKLKFYNGEDIEYMKIYFDTKTKQYKNKKYCTCDKFVTCWCYKTLDDAYNSIISDDLNFYCDDCFFKELIANDDIDKDMLAYYGYKYYDEIPNDVKREILDEVINNMDCDNVAGSACVV